MNIFPLTRLIASNPLYLVGVGVQVTVLAALPQPPIAKIYRHSPVYGVMLANKIMVEDGASSFLFDAALRQKDFCALPLAQKEE